MKAFHLLLFATALMAVAPYAYAEPEDADAPPALPEGKGKPASAIELGDFLSSKELWQLAPDAYVKKSDGRLVQGYYKDELNYPGRKGESISLFGSHVLECVLKFESQKLKSIYALLDCTTHSKDLPRISKNFADTQALINKRLKQQGESADFAFPNSRALKILKWNCPAGRIRLQCNDSLPGAYLSVQIERSDVPDADMITRLGVNRSFYESHVHSSQQGGRVKYLPVPMRKLVAGRYAATTIARQLAFFGSEAEPGMVEQMISGIDKDDYSDLASRFGAYRKLYSLYSRKAAQENALSLLKDYNERAVRVGQPAITCNENAERIFFGEQFQYMNKNILSGIPPPDPIKFAMFKNLITSCVNHNIPLVWTVVRWAPKTESPGSRHVRLIVGYNLDTEEVYFSDAWGIDYEKEAMNFRAAFAITSWLELICPTWIPPSEFPVEPKSKSSTKKPPAKI